MILSKPLYTMETSHPGYSIDQAAGDTIASTAMFFSAPGIKLWRQVTSPAGFAGHNPLNHVNIF